MKDIEAKAIMSALERIKDNYKLYYEMVTQNYLKSSGVTEASRLRQEMYMYQHYCEAIQQSIDAIKPFIKRFSQNEEEQEDENN